MVPLRRHSDESRVILDSHLRRPGPSCPILLVEPTLTPSRGVGAVRTGRVWWCRSGTRERRDTTRRNDLTNEGRRRGNCTRGNGMSKVESVWRRSFGGTTTEGVDTRTRLSRTTPTPCPNRTDPTVIPRYPPRPRPHTVSLSLHLLLLTPHLVSLPDPRPSIFGPFFPLTTSPPFSPCPLSKPVYESPP